MTPPWTTNASSTFLLLVDGRIPSGGYAHSGGIEAALTDGRVEGLPSLGRYLEGRLATTGLCDAALAAASFRRLAEPTRLCAEAAARCPSPALRSASRIEGRGLMRAARSMWPTDDLDAFASAVGAEDPMWSVVLGAVARAAGLDVHHASTAAAYASVAGPAWAAVRLSGIDPFTVASLLADLAHLVDDVARRAVASVDGAVTLRDLPAPASPLQEIGAEERERWEVRLFVS